MQATEQERTAAVTMLAEYYRSELSQLAIAAYLVALEGLDSHELSHAVRSALKRSKFMPSGAELRQYVKDLRYSQRLAAETEASLRPIVEEAERRRLEAANKPKEIE